MAELVKLIDLDEQEHYVAWAHIVDVSFTKSKGMSFALVITTAASMAANDLNQPHRIALKGPHAEAFRVLLEERV